MAKKKIGFWDMLTKDVSYTHNVAECDVCGKEFLAQKDNRGRKDFSKCSYCANELIEHMREFKDKKKKELKEMYNQNYYDLTEVKSCDVCGKEYRSNIANCNTCNSCLREETKKKKKSFKTYKESFWEPNLNYECTCLSCGKEYKTKNIYDVNNCDECKEERKEYKQKYQGRSKETDFKCIVCGEYFKANSNKFMCPGCEEDREKHIEKVSNCNECGNEFLKKNENDSFCSKCQETKEIADIEVCADCGAELFFGQVCSCKNNKF